MTRPPYSHRGLKNPDPPADDRHSVSCPLRHPETGANECICGRKYVEAAWAETDDAARSEAFRAVSDACYRGDPVAHLDAETLLNEHEDLLVALAAHRAALSPAPGGLSDPGTYKAKEDSQWHGQQDTTESATGAATGARTAATDRPSTPATTSAEGTRLVDASPPGADQCEAPGGGLAARIEALADGWDGGERIERGDDPGRAVQEALRGIPTGAHSGEPTSGWNRYDTDTTHVLHIWADGKSYDVTAPKVPQACGCVRWGLLVQHCDGHRVAASTAPADEGSAS